MKSLANAPNTESEWFHFTKEGLSPEDVLKGVLDYGLFAEKIPPCFKSVGLAQFVSGRVGNFFDEKDEGKLKKALSKCTHDYIRYEVLRDSNIPRHMGIPHPESYAVQALAIAKNWKTIAEHCNKPKPAFSCIHVRHLGHGCIFKMNYKGPDYLRFEEDELEWMLGAQYVVVADIAACFPSIYTHSVPWALHGKAAAKKSNNLIEMAGNLLDKCTQGTRDRQTNGLLIGPHASNIISEIILTKIDADLQEKGFNKVKRHVDDYHFYATAFEEAERFVKELGLALRVYEMSLNEKKTKILPLPCPSEESWVSALSQYPLPRDQEIKFSEIRAFLNLALVCVQTIRKSTPLNYAIKILAKAYSKDSPDDNNKVVPRQLNRRAKRMYTQEMMNFSLAYPYLAPLLDEYVFTPYWYEGLKEKIAKFSSNLVKLGLRKLYPDTIAHAIFLALKHDFILDLDNDQLAGVVALDDCITNVLLLEYAKRQKLGEVEKTICKKVEDLLTVVEGRDRDSHWLLIYQVCSRDDLKKHGQSFLADLKSSGFQFFDLKLKGEVDQDNG